MCYGKFSDLGYFGHAGCIGNGMTVVREQSTTFARGPEMNVYEETKDNVAVLSVYGRMMSCQDVMILRSHLTNLAMKGYCRIVIDFTGARWFGSAIIGVLVTAKKALMAGGGDLRLAGMNDRCQRVLEIASLQGVFEPSRTVQEAICSFEPVEFKVDLHGKVSSFIARKIEVRVTC